MKLPLLFTSMALIANSFCFSQCTPNPFYQSDSIGFYPLTSVNCGFTFTSITDSVIYLEIGPGNPVAVTMYFDALKVVSVSNLPSGIAATTDVINYADQNAPYGYWYNSGTVPNQTEILGCLSFVENGTTFASLSSEGPNNNGTFPITISLDLRIAATSPDLSAIIQNGSWFSDVPTSLGGGNMEFERVFNVNSCAPCSATSSTTDTSACGSYSWNGQTYYFTDTYEYNTLNSQGCDSTAVLNLTINPIFSLSEWHTICDTTGVTVGGITYMNPGQYPQYHTSIYGCDSTSTIVINENTTPNVEILGNASIAANTSETYAIVTPPGYTTSWSATNGTVIDGQNTAAATIFWSGDSGEVNVVLDNGICAYEYALLVGRSTGISDVQYYQPPVIPNPSKGIFKLSFPQPVQVKRASVYDVLGNEVLDVTNLSESLIDLSAQPNGIYTVIVQTSKGEMKQKLVKE